MSSSVPFLSVLIRTQGNRFEALKETLLCLEAQTDPDFTVILLVHNADDAGRAAVEQLLSLQALPFAGKIHTEYLEGGTRTTPLNRGAALVKTPYFAMLDDDDLIFDNWVEAFHAEADRAQGRVIRSFGCTQEWKTVTTPTGELCLRAESTITDRYCQPFNLLAQLEDNHTPISCVAIPSDCYHTKGIHFDEALTTAEDWDFIMRCVLTVGVIDTEKTTFLYRLWSNAETSRTLHNAEEWAKNRHIIEEKLDKIPIHTTRQALLQCKNKHAGSSGRRSSAKPFLQPTLGGLLRVCLFNLRAWLRCKKNQKYYLTLLESSSYFDAEWYCEQYPDVKSAKLSPAKHYLFYGWKEMRDPSPGFSTHRYLTRYPDVSELDICPLLHYEMYGKAEQREVEE